MNSTVGGCMSRVILGLAGILLLTCSAFGQFETAEVLGTIHDATGSPIRSASVTLTNESTGIEKKTLSDDSGLYDFFNVAPGRYTVSAELSGFQTFRTTGVVVDVNARQRVDITLQLGAVNQVVNVTGAAETLETDSSQHDQVINTQQIAELPLNGRAYSDLALLSTNVHRSPLSVLFAANGTPREGAFNVNGMRSTYNNFMLDGLDNNAYSPSNQGYSNQVVQPSP